MCLRRAWQNGNVHGRCRAPDRRLFLHDRRERPGPRPSRRAQHAAGPPPGSSHTPGPADAEGESPRPHRAPHAAPGASGGTHHEAVGAPPTPPPGGSGEAADSAGGRASSSDTKGRSGATAVADACLQGDCLDLRHQAGVVSEPCVTGLSHSGDPAFVGVEMLNHCVSTPTKCGTACPRATKCGAIPVHTVLKR